MLETGLSDDWGLLLQLSEKETEFDSMSSCSTSEMLRKIFIVMGDSYNIVGLWDLYFINNIILIIIKIKIII
jgi:hypothetical protein